MSLENDNINHSNDVIADIKEMVIELRADFHSIAKAQKELNESVKQLVDIQIKQELLKQEVTHNHSINVTSISRLAESVERTNSNCKESKEEFEVYKNKLKPIEFLLDNPKAGFFLITVFYLFAINDIRAPILKALGIG